MYASVLTSSFPILPTTTCATCRAPCRNKPHTHQLHNPFGSFVDGLHSRVRLCMSLSLALTLFLPPTRPPTLVSNCYCCFAAAAMIHCLSLIAYGLVYLAASACNKSKSRLKDLRKPKRKKKGKVIKTATTTNLLLPSLYSVSVSQCGVCEHVPLAHTHTHT